MDLEEVGRYDWIGPIRVLWRQTSDHDMIVLPLIWAVIFRFFDGVLWAQLTGQGLFCYIINRFGDLLYSLLLCKQRVKLLLLASHVPPTRITQWDPRR